MPVENIEELSPKQKLYLRTAHAPINLAYGAVRSGKNFSEAARLAVYLRYQPRKGHLSDFIFAGTSIKSIYRIVLKDLFEIVGKENFTYNRQDGSGRIFGRDFYSFGFCNNGAEGSIRGMTAGGAMLTELTLCNEDFWDELNLRVSIAGGMIFADTNPGAPNHWVKTKLLDNPELAVAPNKLLYPLADRQLLAHHFLLNDNPFMSKDPGYIQRLLSMYPPGTLLNKRMILGEWAEAEGRVFDAFSDKNLIDQSELPTEFDVVFCSVDYGVQNACVFYLIGIKDGVYYFIREYSYSGRETGVQQTNSEYRDDFTAFLKGAQPKVVYIDPSASSFIAELSGAGYNVEHAENAVLAGIQTCNELLATSRIKICRQGCPKLPNKLLSYAWDPKAQAKGVEKPIKHADDEADCFRYGIFSGEQHLNQLDFWEEFMKEEQYAA